MPSSDQVQFQTPQRVNCVGRFLIESEKKKKKKKKKKERERQSVLVNVRKDESSATRLARRRKE